MSHDEPHVSHGRFGRFFSDGIRSIIFGLEDSLVSTLGALTGIAAGTSSYFVVVLSGIVIIIAEALSMMTGEYLSTKAEQEVWKRRMREEEREIEEEPKKEFDELLLFYQAKGYDARDAETLAKLVSKNKQWVLEEMAVHEFHMSPVMPEQPKKGAIAMLLSYILGGFFPLAPYFFLPLATAIPVSVVLVATVLFGIGAVKTVITHERWWKSGLEMMSISLATAFIGYLLGLGIAGFFGVPVSTG